MHLLPEDLPSTEFLAGITTGGSNYRATQPTETGPNAEAMESPNPAGFRTRPRPLEGVLLIAR